MTEEQKVEKRRQRNAYLRNKKVNMVKFRLRYQRDKDKISARR